jgi:outer membrane protein OmpA-like peptidoglycan-associated protein
MKAKGASFFWPSFTDLMTSLFFIMLVLYVLTYLKLSNQQKATEQQLNKIKEIQAAANALPPEYFVPDSINKRFSLRKSPEFYTKTDIFKNEEDKDYLINVGKSIRRLIDTLKIKYSDQDIKYIVLIEGMSSLDKYEDNFPLSYKRALAVKNLWDNNGIILNQSVCEIQIAGSGTGGIGRFKDREEIKNQRILIQIVPKIGEIKIE